MHRHVSPARRGDLLGAPALAAGVYDIRPVEVGNAGVQLTLVAGQGSHLRVGEHGGESVAVERLLCLSRDWARRCAVRTASSPLREARSITRPPSRAATPGSSGVAAPPVYRIDVSDGDTVVFRNGQACDSSRSTRPRSSSARSATGELPEALLMCEIGRFFCPAHRSACSPSLKPIASAVRAAAAYVVRASDGVNVNVRLVAVGAAAAYLYRHRRGKYTNRLEFLAKRARARKLGLWRVCPRTPYNPNKGIARRR
jgi:endonuclease YncB( thermonuclease family)